MLLTPFGRTFANLKSFSIGKVFSKLEQLIDSRQGTESLAKPGRFKNTTRHCSFKATLLTFLSQCLDPDHSCRNAVATAKDRQWIGENASPDTGAFCRARDGLCETGIAGAVQVTGEAICDATAYAELPLKRRVIVVDGTGFTLPDTPENQAQYPQPGGQTKGCGFPVMYAVALMCLASGSILKYVTSPLRAHEIPLFRRLHDFFKPGDIIMGDRAFASFATIVLLMHDGVDCIFRMHQRRKVDFRRGRRLGKNDHIVEWTRGPWPSWLCRDVELPEFFRVREVRSCLERKGFRTKKVVLVTTLLDAETYPAHVIVLLYMRRWEIEMRFADIKTTMGIDTLRRITPERVRAELAMSLVAYNLVRAVMADAAALHGVGRSRLSFKSALGRLVIWWSRHARDKDGEQWLSGYRRLLSDLARNLNPDRPGRIEPRVRKRRPKQYPLMKIPRKTLQAELHAA